MSHKTKNHIDVEGRPWAFVGGDRDAVAPGEDAGKWEENWVLLRKGDKFTINWCSESYD
ncbi:hypothetical protein MTR_8g028090 [Medicago truncatula]|uniref:Uncharacterized protein n=1 Tax=Medicago truncatula TaxID=3880 RepID=G7ZYU4_MEDTR|nr:hypothetical protein MTR_8g028090 [Medicago truncatula]